MRKTLLPLLAILAAAPAFAQMDKPQAINAYIHASSPYGEGTLHRLFLKVYDASVWTDASSWSMKTVFALCIHYDLNFDNDALADRSIEEMRHVGTVTKDKEADYRDKLLHIFPNVHSGDVITALYVPGKALTFYHNDKKVGVITDPAFAEGFLSIWLAPNTSEPELRQALVGNSGA